MLKQQRSLILLAKLIGQNNILFQCGPCYPNLMFLFQMSMNAIKILVPTEVFAHKELRMCLPASVPMDLLEISVKQISMIVHHIRARTVHAKIAPALTFVHATADSRAPIAMNQWTNARQIRVNMAVALMVMTATLVIVSLALTEKRATSMPKNVLPTRVVVVVIAMSFSMATPAIALMAFTVIIVRLTLTTAAPILTVAMVFVLTAKIGSAVCAMMGLPDQYVTALFLQQVRHGGGNIQFQRRIFGWVDKRKTKMRGEATATFF